MNINALWDLLDKALGNFGKAQERRRKMRKLRRDLEAIEKRRKREHAQADAMAEAYQARLREIKALTDPDERLRQLAKLDRERKQ